MKKIALGLLVAGILAVSAAGVFATSNFATDQEWSVYTAGSAYLLSYNYTTAALNWSGNLTSTTTVGYTKPDPGQWMGFWTYDAVAGVYTEAVYIYIEAFS